MEVKRCFKCKLTKPLSAFAKNITRRDGLSSQCRECQKILRRGHYLRNKEKIRKQVAQFKAEYKEWYKGLKNKPCTDCGKSYPWYVLEFDHREPEKKSFNVGTGAYLNKSKEEILKEIEKCDLVCANCHRERTYKRDWCNGST